MRPTEEQIEKAVTFWGNRLGKFGCRMLSEEERRDPQNKDSAFGEIWAEVQGSGFTVTNEKREEFKKELRQVLETWEDKKKWERDRDHVFMATDYQVSVWGPLWDAVNNSGLNPQHYLFPIKTRMWLNSNGTVVVSEGEGAPGKVI